ncbi:MAG: DsbA family protein [Gemmatimonadaceae bacterium]
MVKKAKQAPRAKSSKQGFYVALAVVALVGVGAMIALSRRGGNAVKPIDPNLKPVATAGYSLGNPNAPVEVLEFADFECPACAVFANVTEPDVRTKLVNTGLIKVRFFDFPISDVHRNSVVASRAAACANESGKFWEMHDILFMNQDRWSTGATSNPAAMMVDFAKQIGLDGTKFSECLESGRHDAEIVAHRLEAEKLQVNSTPSFLIGGNLVAGAMPYDEFKRHVDEALAKAKPAAPGGPAAPVVDSAKP